LSNPRESYIHYLFGQAASSVTHFGMEMRTPIPDVIMKDMILHSVDELLITTGKPPLSTEEKDYYDKIMGWLRQDSEKLKPAVDKILMGWKGKMN